MKTDKQQQEPQLTPLEQLITDADRTLVIIAGECNMHVYLDGQDYIFTNRLQAHDPIVIQLFDYWVDSDSHNRDFANVIGYSGRKFKTVVIYDHDQVEVIE